MEKNSKRIIQIIFIFLLPIFLSGQISISPGISIPCESVSVNSTFTVSTGITPYSYTVQCLSNGFSYTASANSNIGVFTPTSNGVYTLTVYDAASSFIGTATQTVNYATTTTVNILSGSNTPSICLGSSDILYFDNTTIGVGTGLSFSLSNFYWNTGANSLTLSVSPTVTSVYSGTCLITSSASRTCSANGNRTVIVNNCPSSGISKYTASNPLFSVYPIPVSEKLLVLTEQDSRLISNLKIYDSFGRPIKSQEKYDSGINVQDLIQGVYYLTFVYQNSKMVF